MSVGHRRREIGRDAIEGKEIGRDGIEGERSGEMPSGGRSGEMPPTCLRSNTMPSITTRHPPAALCATTSDQRCMPMRSSNWPRRFAQLSLRGLQPRAAAAAARLGKVCMSKVNEAAVPLAAVFKGVEHAAKEGHRRAGRSGRSGEMWGDLGRLRTCLQIE